MFCEVCNSRLQGRQTRFCSKPCQHTWEAQDTQVGCVECGTTYTVKRLVASRSRFSSRCRGCISRGALPKNMVGENNPRWKGGHKHWSKGRYGKDKDGLSWKVQRKLAWERDSLTCQHCGVKGKRNPDVHHISPWMNSHSHSLDNLICLCKSCHMKEDAKVHEQWGGQLVQDKPKAVSPTAICSCGKKGRQFSKKADYKCHSCRRLKE